MMTVQEQAREFYMTWQRQSAVTPREVLCEFAAAFHAYMLEQRQGMLEEGFGKAEPAAQPSAPHREPVDKFSGLPSAAELEGCGNPRCDGTVHANGDCPVMCPELPAPVREPSSSENRCKDCGALLVSQRIAHVCVPANAVESGAHLKDCVKAGTDCDCVEVCKMKTSAPAPSASEVSNYDELKFALDATGTPHVDLRQGREAQARYLGQVLGEVLKKAGVIHGEWPLTEVELLTAAKTYCESAPESAGPVCQCGDGGCIECWPQNFTKEALIEELRKRYGAPAANVTGEQFLARRGFADSRSYSSTELGPLLEEYARGGAPAEPQRWRDVKVGDVVRGKQFSGQGEVVSISELRAPMIHVKLENGNTWAYEAETIIAVPKERP